MSHSELLPFTLVGLTSTGAAPVMEVVMATDGKAAFEHATRFLQDHHSCTQVELWAAKELLYTLKHPTDAGSGDAPA